MKGEPLQPPHEKFAAQTPFFKSEREAGWQVRKAPAPQLQRPMVKLTKSFIPNAIFQQLYHGYASYLAEMRELSILFIGIRRLTATGPESLPRMHEMMRAVQAATYQFEGSINN